MTRRGTSIALANTILIAALFAAIGLVLYAMNILKSSFVKTDTVITTTESVSEETKEDEKESYIEETNYKGVLSEYPDLYEIPFAKSDDYISNKDFSADHSDIFDECENDATDFFENLFNVDYREIAEDKTSFVNTVMENCDYEAYHTENLFEENEETYPFFSYIEELADYFITNQVEMKAKFYTDDSLVYSDYYTFVRGELVFTIYASEDEESEYEIGKEYQIPMEVAMHRSALDSSNRLITAFGKAEDTMFFLNP